ncbi:MAG: hypothetical protein A3E01_00625 [Gammaproteobacteria bacterium RIFCSPHIGHO2_12_FULL_63_22]|nr:MAG: hypothetical protein A3E01_00625 [Gammaproteobacteria bacterium RIFCSPHIGHO2_12_FULL_63_22]
MDPRDQAARALTELKSAIIAFLRLRPGGAGNSEIARELGLESDFHGKQKNYLSWSVIGLLVNDGILSATHKGRRVTYSIREKNRE